MWTCILLHLGRNTYIHIGRVIYVVFNVYLRIRFFTVFLKSVRFWSVSVFSSSVFYLFVIFEFKCFFLNACIPTSWKVPSVVKYISHFYYLIFTIKFSMTTESPLWHFNPLIKPTQAKSLPNWPIITWTPCIYQTSCPLGNVDNSTPYSFPVHDNKKTNDYALWRLYFLTSASTIIGNSLICGDVLHVCAGCANTKTLSAFLILCFVYCET